MHEHVEAITSQFVRIGQVLAYSASGGLIVTDWLVVLDHHAGAIGVMIAVLTYVTNFVFQCLNRKAVLNTIKSSI